MSAKTDWPAAIRPLLEKYKDKRHPLEYRNTYQLIVMVVLSAQSTDDVVNQVAPAFFKTYPDMKTLSAAKPEELYPSISKIRNFGHKAAWLVAIAKQIGTDDRIPLTMDLLTALPGIGRKSASVILREAGKPPEGIIVDIHVIRVAPRLGIAKDPDPKKMEQELMKQLPRDEWDAGMSMSFLGREICRPKPECERCLMNPVCAYYAQNKKNPGKAPKPAKPPKSAKTSKPSKTSKPTKTTKSAKTPKKTVPKRVKKRSKNSGK